MKIYIDLFFIFNVFTDAIIIMGVSYILKRRTNIIRIIVSSLIGGIFSLLLFTNTNRIIIEGVSVAIMCIVCFGYRNIGYTIKNIFYMYISSSVLGGLLYLFNIKIDNSLIYYLVTVIIGGEVTILYCREMRKLKNNYNNYYKVDIYFDKDIISLMGFVDTGNNLYDIYKHRPIIIVDKKYEVDDKYLLVPYNTVSGEGLLKCVKPKYIVVENNIIKNVLVGFSDSIKFIDGVEVILHKDVMKGE